MIFACSFVGNNLQSMLGYERRAGALPPGLQRLTNVWTALCVPIENYDATIHPRCQRTLCHGCPGHCLHWIKNAAKDLPRRCPGPIAYACGEGTWNGTPNWDVSRGVPWAVPLGGLLQSISARIYHGCKQLKESPAHKPTRSVSNNDTLWRLWLSPPSATGGVVGGSNRARLR